MASKKSQSPKPVEAITHQETRANIPTADAHDLVAPEDQEAVAVTYPREIRSPMLVWKGKEELDEHDLQVDAPPIYIQEKIDPRVLIENLRKTAAAGEPEPELTLFDTFDGLSELDLVEFYKHSANWSNRMVLGDSLQVMASLAERERLRGKVQMIYLDPPYGIKFGSNWQLSTRDREVRDGRLEDAAREAEQIKAFRDTWTLGIHSYLTYFRDRLLLARDLLTESGSAFVQIGDENVHRVRAVLDEVFGDENFCSQILFSKTSGQTSRLLAETNDTILWYAKSKDRVKYRQLFVDRPPFENPKERYVCVETEEGDIIDLSVAQKSGNAPIPEGRILKLENLTSQSGSESSRYEIHYEGKSFKPGGRRGWSTHAEGIERLRDAGYLSVRGNTLWWKSYRDVFPYRPLANSWLDARSNAFGDSKTYIVQTNARVVERCIQMTTDPGDLVLDPTCGSGTTAFVSEHLGRRWITIDTSRVALALARQRLMASRFPYFLLADSTEGRKKEAELSGTQLPPSVPSNNVRNGFVYERGVRVTLKSIANNPDIRAGMSASDIETAIRRHAHLETLYDRPIEGPGRIRVAGPFTVESLSPHRNLSAPTLVEVDQGSRVGDHEESFEQTILENLRAAGIQNGRRAERLEFDLVEPYAGTHVQAVGVREDAPEGAPRRVGLSLGPQYGTVAPSYVKKAAREASKDNDLDLLCILAFAFDPQVLNTDEEYVATDESFDVAGTRSLGRIPILLVRMNADLLMGEELKKTGAGNLFTVFGEPDIAITEDDKEVVVELLGVDVYDPTTGEVRSDQTDKVAVWMIDTDYDEESFFVRHCYFTGGQDPYKRLKKALNADIDEEAWSTLYRTVSRPFPRPSTGKIAVKVINDYGDEVVKVYDVA